MKNTRRYYFIVACVCASAIFFGFKVFAYGDSDLMKLIDETNDIISNTDDVRIESESTLANTNIIFEHIQDYRFYLPTAKETQKIVKLFKRIFIRYYLMFKPQLMSFYFTLFCALIIGVIIENICFRDKIS